MKRKESAPAAKQEREKTIDKLLCTMKMQLDISLTAVAVSVFALVIATVAIAMEIAMR